MPKGSSGGSGRGGGGGGGGGGSGGDSGTLEKLRENYRERELSGGAGENFSGYADEVRTTAQPNAAMVAKFREGYTNLNPVLVTENSDGTYRAVDRNSAIIAASAAAANQEGRINMIVVPRNSQDLRAARAMRSLDSSPVFSRGDTTKYVYNLYADNLTGRGKATPQATAAAATMLRTNSRNWAPVIVRQTGEDSYTVVGNRGAYEAARRAGITRIKTIVVND